MKSYLIAMAVLHGLGVLINMARLGRSKPWPRTIDVTPLACVIGLALTAGLFAWNMTLLSR